MSARKKASVLPTTPQIVGTIHSPGSLKRALSLKPGDVDALELRVDHFAGDAGKLRAAADRLSLPCIVTVRHPKEGGANGLAPGRRKALYREFFEVAAMIDIELQSVDLFSDIIAEARSRNVGVIISDHHFRTTPGLAELRKRFAVARKAKADIFKLAATVNKAADLARLYEFFASIVSRQATSMMGMGALGKVSRLLFTRSGSLLNYGYLHQPQVPGQWEATTLKKRLLELNADC